MTHDATLRHTPLYAAHAALGARFAPFAGWEMPTRYGSIIDETRAVRGGAGLFDVSHMGRIEIGGGGALGLLNAVLSVDPHRIRTGRARYNLICDERGGIIDDCIIYRRAEDRFLLIPNASNTDTVLDWLREHSGEDVSIANVTEDVAMIACQGPSAAETLQRLTDRDLSRVRPFRAVNAAVSGADAFLARTGYTGEDGFEIMLPSERAAALWESLMELGAKACGLGARDVLRLEAGLPLYGNDIDTSTNPYEARLGRFVEPDREGYLAGEELRQLRLEWPHERRLTGFRVSGRGIARPGYKILDGEWAIGLVTSGGPSPTLDLNIGMGYVPTVHSEPETLLDVEIRGRPVEVWTVPLPFYRRRTR